MKILQLCHKVPFPPKDGGCIAINNLTNGLIEQGCELKLLSLNTKKHIIDIDKLPADYRSKTNIEAVSIDTEVKIIPAFLNLFSSGSYNIERFNSSAFADKLIHVLKSSKFDIVQLESLYVSMYIDIIRKHSKAKIVLRAHNVEHLLWEHNAKLETNPIKKVYLNLLAKRLKQYELKTLNAVDSIVAITKEDEAYFKKQGFANPLQTASFGVDTKIIGDNNYSKSEPNSIFHIGAMDWQPNVEGIHWFLNEVWNKLNFKHTHLKLYLAGRNTSAEFKTLNKANIVIAGEVENAFEFMQGKGLMIVPLLSGGGMRVKIIEGMALGKTIISTSIGAEGIECENNKNILIANTANEFVEAISKCIIDKSFADAIGNNARSFVEAKYDNKVICKKLVDFYQTLITK